LAAVGDANVTMPETITAATKSAVIGVFMAIVLGVTVLLTATAAPIQAYSDFAPIS